MSYYFELLQMNINSLKTIYPFLEVGSIGKSVMGKELTYIRLGTGPKEVFYSGAIHSNEWITATLLMKFIENFCRGYVRNGNIYGYNLRDIFNDTSIYIVPMVNPDAVDLVVGALSENTEAYRNAAGLARNYPALDFQSGWKANIVGVNFLGLQLFKLSNHLHIRIIKKLNNFARFFKHADYLLSVRENSYLDK